MKLINDNHGDEMKEYTITIQEIMRKSINIEAENEEQAKQLIQSKTVERCVILKNVILKQILKSTKRSLSNELRDLFFIKIILTVFQINILSFCYLNIWR